MIVFSFLNPDPVRQGQLPITVTSHKPRIPPWLALPRGLEQLKVDDGLHTLHGFSEDRHRHASMTVFFTHRDTVIRSTMQKRLSRLRTFAVLRTFGFAPNVRGLFAWIGVRSNVTVGGRVTPSPAPAVKRPV